MIDNKTIEEIIKEKIQVAIEVYQFSNNADNLYNEITTVLAFRDAHKEFKKIMDWK